jgi:hypothetical protein
MVRAALTMNIGMTALQDQLASQIAKPTPEQQELIRNHPRKGVLLLSQLWITDELWLDIVGGHHDESTSNGPLRLIAPGKRLSRVLRVVDRYAAMISPRKSRFGRSAADSVRSITAAMETQNDEVGSALMRVVGLCPPGTFVRLDNGEVGVVMRRSDQANQPQVAIVMNEAGDPISPPRMHWTVDGGPRIEAALAAPAVRMRLNHYRLLHLSAGVAQQSGR